MFGRQSTLAIYLPYLSVHLDGTKINVISGIKCLMHSYCTYDPFFQSGSNNTHTSSCKQQLLMNCNERVIFICICLCHKKSRVGTLLHFQPTQTVLIHFQVTHPGQGHSGNRSN